MNKGVAPAHWRDAHEDIIDEDNDDEAHFQRKDEAGDDDQYNDQMMW